MPWPISEWLTMTVTDSSGAIRTNAFGAKTDALAGAFERERAASSGTCAAIHNPLPLAADVFRNSRRGISADFVSGIGEELRDGDSTKGLSTSLRSFMTTSFPRTIQRRGGWRGGCANTCRSGKYFRTSLRQYLCPLVWRFPSGE